MKTMLALTVMATVLITGCQSSQQSLNSAYNTCDRTGLRPGSWEYQRCTQSIYEENRHKADQAAAAVAVGVAAGAVGAYAISQASKKRDKNDRYYPAPVRRHNRDTYSGRPVGPAPVYGTRPSW